MFPHPSPMRRGVRMLWALPLLCVAACGAARPRFSVEGRHGAAWSDDPVVAQRLAAALDRQHVAVRGLLPDTLDVAIELWHVSEDEWGKEAFWRRQMRYGVGVALPGDRILLRSDELPEMEGTLVHELTHALTGPGWEALPSFAMEGLANVAEARLAPHGRLARILRLLSAWEALGGAAPELRHTARTTGGDITFTTRPVGGTGAKPVPDPKRLLGAGRAVYFGVTSRDRDGGLTLGLYGLAYLVVDRIAERHGAGFLHEACLRAEDEGFRLIPVDWLLEAAELPGDTDRWLEEVRASLSRDDLLLWVRAHARLLARHALSFSTGPATLGLEPGADWSEEDYFELHWVLPGFGPPIDLLEVPQIGGRVREGWRVRRRQRLRKRLSPATPASR